MRRYRLLALVAAAMLSLVFALPANANLLIDINKSTQRMTVSLDGAELFNWPVSTGVAGYDTPSGEFKPFRMERDHYSREWDDAPMPHSVFFTQQGHAIHGSNHTKAIGRPASHGCVRLAPANARVLFDLVRQEKMANTRVVLRGETPTAAAPPVARRDLGQDRDYARGYSTDELDDGFAVALPEPPAPRRRVVVRENWREYNDGQRYYYYRAPQYVPPQYTQPQRRQYGYGQPYPYYPYGR